MRIISSGWVILGGLILLFGSLIALFPKVLPREAVRRAIAKERNKEKILESLETPPSLKVKSFGFFFFFIVLKNGTFFLNTDLLQTLKRLLKNKIYVCNNLASVFYCCGQMPYWIFMPKYIETQFKQNASIASFVTGKKIF